MSGFRNLLKSDTPTASNDTGASRNAALGGQGSHFPRSNQSEETPLATRAADAVGSTVTGTEPHTAGPSDTSAAPAPISQAQATSGPEAGGSGHVGTVSGGDSAFGATQSPTTGESTSRSFPKTLRSGQNTGTGPDTSTAPASGTAAIGQTTTYSSRPLASGDPTGSVVDHQSNDPLTYKLPEAGSHDPSAAGASSTSPAVTSSAAATAASLAWSAQNKGEKMPGEYPSAGYENPYKASSLDPRVDGGKAGDTTSQPSSSLPTRARDSDLGPSSAAAGTGASAAAASQAFASDRTAPTTSRDTTGPAPSSLTTTTDPAARSAEYGTSSDTKVPDSAPLATTESQTAGEQQGFLGRTLGAVGLGSAAGAAASYLGYGSKDPETSEPRDTSAAATQPGITSQESGPPKHYRRESIPTTAYPGGPSSPRAVAPPIGGTVDPRRSVDQGADTLGADTRGSNDRGIGSAAATTAGVGAASGLGAATSGRSDQQYDDSSRLRSDVGASRTSDSTRDAPRNTSATETDASKIASPGTATADAIDGGAFPLGSTNREAEMVGQVDRDPATVGGATGTSASAGRSSDAPPQASTSRGQETGDGSTARNVGAGAAAAGAAGVGAAGAYGLQHHRKSDDLRSSAAEDAGRQPTSTTGDATLAGGHSYTITGGEHAAPVDAISSRDPNDRDSTSRTTGVGSSTSPDAPIDAVAAAPGRYQGQDFDQRDTSSRSALGAGAATAGVGGLAYSSRDSNQQGTIHDATTVGPAAAGSSTTGPSAYGTSAATATSDQPLQRDDGHTGRNTALGAAAGTAAVGGAAYAAQDRSNERELEKQREADAKEAAKREKEHQKELEKEEKHRQKEAEKEEKHRQKEVEKEEKHRQKEAEKEEKLERERTAEADKREQARLAAEEEDRKRREREAAAGVGAAGAAGAGTAAATQPHEEKKEKKPSIFRRIFKRRKNKDTGEDEDYSTDDEDDKAAHAAAAGGSSVPHHQSEDKGRNVLGHGRDKEAYKEHPAWKGPVTDVAAENSMNSPGQPHPGAEERLGYEQGSTPAGTDPTPREGGTAAISGASDNAAGTSSGVGTGAAGTSTTTGTDARDLPRESLTGLPYDPAKDPAAAARIAEASGTGIGGRLEGAGQLGEIGDTKR